MLVQFDNRDPANASAADAAWWRASALVNREYNVIMATTLMSALMTMFGILLADILYAVVDPRIRYA